MDTIRNGCETLLLFDQLARWMRLTCMLSREVDTLDIRVTDF